MTQIASAHATSPAEPAAFFATWADIDSWPVWNTDIEWIRMDGPFEEGATGRLKPKGGPAARFVIQRLTETEFVDVTHLVGARLTFSHELRRADGHTTVSVTVHIDGPLRWLWTKILGADLAKAAQPDVENLVAAAQRVPV